MKHAAAKSPVDILSQIETIEKDILSLKLSVLKKFTSSGKKTVKLKGVLKGFDITDEDINFAQKSLYSKIEV
jgi:uncharacterized protein (DUF2344 family)